MIMKTMRLIQNSLLVLTLAGAVKAEVKMSRMFGNDMVLQRELPVPIYGWADPGEKVTVTFAGQEKSTPAGNDGKWQVVLDPLEMSRSGQTLTVKGSNTLSFKGVLVGEVWLCAGQSNMAGSFGDKHPWTDEYNKLKLKHLRFCAKTRASWGDITERTSARLSRVAFYFGLHLYQELDIPIGLITRHNGGTPIQAWMSSGDAEMIRKKLDIPEDWREEGKKIRNPGFQYDDKISADNKVQGVVPYAIRGVAWYQGERNAKGNTGWEYDKLLAHFIDCWRKDWGERSGLETRKFPFYYVQIPTDIHLRSYEFPWVRDRQRRALEITENTGMAIFWEEGPGLHPADKELAGKRLALLALAKNYGRKDLVYSGPLLDDVRYADGKARLSFAHVGGGLRERNGKDKLDYFELAGEDVKYHPAEAVIDGDEVVVTSAAVSDPKYVRYLFNANGAVEESTEGGAGDKGSANFSLMNAEGIPAAAFMTDDEIPGPRKEMKR